MKFYAVIDHALLCIIHRHCQAPRGGKYETSSSHIGWTQRLDNDIKNVQPNTLDRMPQVAWALDHGVIDGGNRFPRQLTRFISLPASLSSFYASQMDCLRLMQSTGVGDIYLLLPRN
jgi:hypothetical protein